MDKDIAQIPIADFEANCLRFLDQVTQQRCPIMITRHGKPIAKLMPVDEEPIDLFGYMAETATMCGDIIDPIEELNPVYFENRSFSSLWSRWCLTRGGRRLCTGPG